MAEITAGGLRFIAYFEEEQTCFASEAGQLAGNRFATILEGREQLAVLGERVLWQSARNIAFEEK